MDPKKCKGAHVRRPQGDGCASPRGPGARGAKFALFFLVDVRSMFCPFFLAVACIIVPHLEALLPTFFFAYV